jgi:uncharacterized protein YdeI (YjbR/CyaY-like superfamily)
VRRNLRARADLDVIGDLTLPQRSCRWPSHRSTWHGLIPRRGTDFLRGDDAAEAGAGADVDHTFALLQISERERIGHAGERLHGTLGEHNGPMEELDGAEVIAFRDAATWEAWLADHHERQAGVWLKLAKQGSGIPSVTADEVVDVGLCYGWVSGQRKGLNDRYYLQKYVPRRPGSLWSKVNVEKVERLLAQGRMREPGMAEVRAAQSDGRWDAAYESQKNATAPADVIAALEDNDRAKAVFDSLAKTDQYRLYLPVLQARSSEARAARVAKLVAMLESRNTAE